MESAQRVPRWETEIPLLILVILTSIAMWIMLVVSIVGIFYAVLFAVFFLLAHLALIAHLRGSSIKLGPDQLPHLHVRVAAMAEKLGMKRVPEAYLMQAGGALNAFATKLFRANFVVLYSDLVEACGEDDASLDFVIGHELGHIRAGHVRLQWPLIGRFFPFIGGAYSRAREYTADRYGFAVTTDPRAATRGLVLLAAGPRHAKEVNVEAMLRQRHDMNSVAMKIGSWMSTHPPISDRIAELDRTLNAEKVTAAATSLAAAALIAVGFLVPIVGGGWFFQKLVANMNKAVAQAQQNSSAQPSTSSTPRPQVVVKDVNAAAAQAILDLHELQSAAEDYKKKTGTYPDDTSALYATWQLAHPGAREPRDPFDKTRYGFEPDGDGGYELWSGGSGKPWNRAELDITVTGSNSPRP